MGLVGRFWTPSGGILHIRAEEFLDFNADGYAKTAANFRLQPLTNGGTRLTTETRIWCTSLGVECSSESTGLASAPLAA